VTNTGIIDTNLYIWISQRSFQGSSSTSIQLGTSEIKLSRSILIAAALEAGCYTVI